MDFNEKIGDYSIIRHGEIIVYRNESVDIQLTEEGSDSIVVRIVFKEDGGNTGISEELQDNTLIMNFLNFNRNYSMSGIFEPIEIGKSDNDSVLYFNCVVFTINSKDGNRLLKYSFLKRN